MRSIKFTRLSETLVNVSIVVSAMCLLLLVAIKLESGHRRYNSTVASMIGKQFPIAIPGMHHKGALVLALQLGCQFCENSMPFYQQLTFDAAAHGENVIYFLPNPVDASTKFLSLNGLAKGTTIQEDLKAIKVTGTPTLFLLDNNNKVQGMWVGQLSVSREQQLQTDVENLSQSVKTLDLGKGN